MDDNASSVEYRYSKSFDANENEHPNRSMSTLSTGSFNVESYDQPSNNRSSFDNGPDGIYPSNISMRSLSLPPLPPSIPPNPNTRSHTQLPIPAPPPSRLASVNSNVSVERKTSFSSNSVSVNHPSLGPSPSESTHRVSVSEPTEPVKTPGEYLQEISLDLIRYHESITHMLESTQCLSNAAADDLRNVLTYLGEAVKNITSDYEAMSLRTPVMALLDLAHVCWNFDNLTVAHYRKAILSLEPTSEDVEKSIGLAQYPIYLSNVPTFPSTVQKVTLNIKLYKSENDNPITFTKTVYETRNQKRLDVDPVPTADDIMRSELKMYHPFPQQIENWILKAEGIAEYIYGPTPIFDFAYIRESIRKGREVNLNLIRRKVLDLDLVERLRSIDIASKEELYERAGIFQSETHDVCDDRPEDRCVPPTLFRAETLDSLTIYSDDEEDVRTSPKRIPADLSHSIQTIFASETQNVGYEVRKKPVKIMTSRNDKQSIAAFMLASPRNNDPIQGDLASIPPLITDCPPIVSCHSSQSSQSSKSCKLPPPLPPGFGSSAENSPLPFTPLVEPIIKVDEVTRSPEEGSVDKVPEVDEVAEVEVPEQDMKDSIQDKEPTDKSIDATPEPENTETDEKPVMNDSIQKPTLEENISKEASPLKKSITVDVTLPVHNIDETYECALNLPVAPLPPMSTKSKTPRGPPPAIPPVPDNIDDLVNPIQPTPVEITPSEVEIVPSELESTKSEMDAIPELDNEKSSKNKKNKKKSKKQLKAEAKLAAEIEAQKAKLAAEQAKVEAELDRLDKEKKEQDKKEDKEQSDSTQSEDVKDSKKDELSVNITELKDNQSQSSNADSIDVPHTVPLHTPRPTYTEDTLPKPVITNDLSLERTTSMERTTSIDNIVEVCYIENSISKSVQVSVSESRTESILCREISTTPSVSRNESITTPTNKNLPSGVDLSITPGAPTVGVMECITPPYHNSGGATFQRKQSIYLDPSSSPTALLHATPSISTPSAISVFFTPHVATPNPAPMADIQEEEEEDCGTSTFITSPMNRSQSQVTVTPSTSSRPLSARPNSISVSCSASTSSRLELPSSPSNYPSQPTSPTSTLHNPLMVVEDDMSNLKYNRGGPRASIFRYSALDALPPSSTPLAVDTGLMTISELATEPSSTVPTPLTSTSSEVSSLFNTNMFKPTAKRVRVLPEQVGEKKVVSNPFPDTANGSSSLAISPFPTFMESHHQKIPIRFKVAGIDNINEKIIPRFDSSITRIFLASCVVHGTQIVTESMCSTHVVDRASYPRFGGYMPMYVAPDGTVSPIELDISSVPRASKMVFVLVGQRGEEDKKVNNVALAWSSIQLFDEDNNFVQGDLNLPLWPIPIEGADESDMLAMGLGASGMCAIANTRKKDDKDEKKEEKKKKEDKKDKKDKKKVVITPHLSTKGFDINNCNFVFRGTNRPNLMSQDAPRLSVEFDYYECPIIMEQPEVILSRICPPSPHQDVYSGKRREIEKTLAYIEQQDALYVLSDEDKQILWTMRDQLVKSSKMLVFFVAAIDWFNIDHRYECYRLLPLWAIPSLPSEMISLLDAHLPDYRVRQYAVDCLSRLTTSELQLYILQLTQALKHEPYHDNPLSRFLINRAITAPYQIGHHLYWALKNEIACDPPFAERYTLLLETFLSFCPVAANNLRNQQLVIDKLNRLATTVQGQRSKLSEKELMKFYMEQLEHVNKDLLKKLPNGRFQVPLDPRLEATTLIPEKCKIMSSKMAPLWLVFNNADIEGKKHYIIFKAGDDLRQDILTLQILKFMDEVWLKNDMDLRLSPYNVIATGMTENKKGCGMIEIVLNSATTAGIQMEFGGGASGAFRIDTLDLYLRKHNVSEESYNKAVLNFVYSCAGYCIATYVIGIGDRHNGNIMLNQDGHLFHIDFGHFLGNFKSKFGINRERAAFVFTPEMAFVMGGKGSPNYVLFKETCVKAFLCLRRHAADIENLFSSMVNAGMPELTCVDDVQYIRKQLCPDLSEAKAIDIFKGEFKKASNALSRRLDNYFHLLKHNKAA